MAIEKELLHEMIEKLSDSDKKTAFDFLQYLLERAKKKTTSWDENDIRDNQLETRAVIDSIQHEVAGIRREITGLRESAATKQDLQFYDMKISEHEREIFKIKQQ